MIDKKDFVALVDQKSDMLYRVARTILRNDEDCKDALQEAMLKAWENRHKLRDMTMFNTWATRILINECHTLLRKKWKYLLKEEVEASLPSRAHDPALQWAFCRKDGACRWCCTTWRGIPTIRLPSCFTLRKARFEAG